MEDPAPPLILANGHHQATRRRTRLHQTDRVACYNVLATRLAMHFMPTIGSSTQLFSQQSAFMGTSVDRHMRILYKVDGDAIMFIRAPSEPVLAVAAAMIMMPPTREALRDGARGGTRYAAILETIRSTCLGSPDVDVLKGVRGEFVARLLLTSAWDAVKINDPHFLAEESSSERVRHILQPVQVERIIHGLATLTQENTDRIHDHFEEVCDQIRNDTQRMRGSSLGPLHPL